MPEPETRFRTRRETPHPFPERMRVVELYVSGLGSKRIAKVMGLDDSTVRRWLRKYRATGLESLKPYWQDGRLDKEPQGLRDIRRVTNERLFTSAFELYTTTLEPVASITRRCGIDYQSFVYHLKRFHPEMVAHRKNLKEKSIVL